MTNRGNRVRKSFWSMALIVAGASSLLGQTSDAPSAFGPSVDGYASIQAAIDANPDRPVFVPARDYEIAKRLLITVDGGGLWGPGRLVQSNPKEPIVHVRDAAGIVLDGLSLTRPEGARETNEEAIRLDGARNAKLRNLTLVDNHSQAGAITILGSEGTDVLHCRIENYTRIAVDDRMRSDNERRDWGYAFRCIDGTGIVVKDSRGTLIEGNRIVETHLLPTPEIQREHELGTFVNRAPKRGALVSEETWQRGSVSNWHQGSAILVGSGCDQTRVLGNHVENAAQGIDIHSDHVIVANNVVDNAFIGMKAMHGSRNVIVSGNQFSRNDLWAIGLMPGVASHRGDASGRPANVDGGSIVAGNVISDFGYGNAYWVWGRPDDRHDGCFPIRLDAGQEADDPPLRDVIVAGNVIYDPTRGAADDDTADRAARPRYRYSVFLSPRPDGPRNVHFHANVFHPGEQGVANAPLEP